MTVEGEVRYLKPMPPLVPGPGAPGQPR